jgi:hypothetical protein
MKFVLLEHLGKKVVIENIDDAIECIREILKEESSDSITVSLKSISEEELNNLQEFEGF